jgi:hypothetical protein
LRNNLLAAYPADLVNSLPEGRLRAEQLSIAELAEIFTRLSGAALRD